MLASVRKAFLTACAAGAMLASVPAMAQAIDEQTLAEPCAGCHGTDGSSVGSAPTIANLTVDYFVQVMKEYAEGKRASTVMVRIAKGYTEPEFKAMAMYFDKKSFGRTAQKFDTALVDKGKGLQAKYCENCHEQGGKKSDGIGVLAGQRIEYLTYSVQDFMSGKRSLDMDKRKKQKMEEMMKDHGEAGFQAVLNFYASQK
jgi:sulfide dehydrogenase cytochrome subunit